MTKQSQPCKGPQDCYRTFKASSTSTIPPTGTELRERSAPSQNNMNEATDKESHLREEKVLSKQEGMTLLEALDCTTTGKCTMKKWKPEQMKCSDKSPNRGKLQHKFIKREAHEDSSMGNPDTGHKNPKN